MFEVSINFTSQYN